MWALFTFRLVFLLEDEARTSLPGLVTITRDPEHCVCWGLIGATLMSNVDNKLSGLANSMMTISVEIRSSNLLVVMMTTTVAMKTDIVWHLLVDQRMQRWVQRGGRALQDWLSLVVNICLLGCDWRVVLCCLDVGREREGRSENWQAQVKTKS